MLGIMDINESSQTSIQYFKQNLCVNMGDTYYYCVLIVWHSAYWHSMMGGGQLMLDLLHTVPPLWEEDLEDLENVKGSPTLRC